MAEQYLDVWSERRNTGKLSILDRIKLATQKPEQTLISGLDATKLALMVDISHWQGDVDIAQMVMDGKVACLLPKCSDGKQVVAGDPYAKINYVDDWFYRNVQKAYDAKIPCIPYHYVQLAITDYTAEGLAAWNYEVLKFALSKIAAKKSYHAICLDVEETNASDISGSDVVLKLMDKIRNDPVLSTVPLIIYSSMSVLNRYTRLREQLSYPGANQNLWMAQWVYNTVTTTTWENFWSVYVPKVEMKVLTPGFASWWAVQWSSSFILPGCTGRTDVSFYRAPTASLYSWLNYTVTQPEPPEPEEPEPPEPPEPGDPDTAAALARIEASLARIEAKLDAGISMTWTNGGDA